MSTETRPEAGLAEALAETSDLSIGAVTGIPAGAMDRVASDLAAAAALIGGEN